MPTNVYERRPRTAAFEEVYLEFKLTADDVSDGDTSQDVTPPGLPSGMVLYEYVRAIPQVNATTTAESLTDLDVQMGTAGDPDYLITSFDLVDVDVDGTPVEGTGTLLASATKPTIQFDSTAENLNAAGLAFEVTFQMAYKVPIDLA